MVVGLPLLVVTGFVVAMQPAASVTVKVYGWLLAGAENSSIAPAVTITRNVPKAGLVNVNGEVPPLALTVIRLLSTIVCTCAESSSIQPVKTATAVIAGSTTTFVLAVPVQPLPSVTLIVYNPPLPLAALVGLCIEEPNELGPVHE